MVKRYERRFEKTKMTQSYEMYTEMCIERKIKYIEEKESELREREREREREKKKKKKKSLLRVVAIWQIGALDTKIIFSRSEAKNSTFLCFLLRKFNLFN